MRLTYRLQNRAVIDSLDIPLRGGKVFWVRGSESREYALLAGILSGLIPIRDRLRWEILQSLIDDYCGQVEITEGSLFKNNAYLGPDPEHHLMFATVWEELEFQIGSRDPTEVLSSLGLDKSYLEREVHSLSGGEKMKLSLAIAFARPAESIILHGVVPWLDKAGRSLLSSQIKAAKQIGTCVALFEHEQTAILSLADEVWTPFPNHHAPDPIAIDLSEISTTHAPSSSLSARGTVLDFSNVVLKQRAGSSSSQALLSNVSFSILENQSYFLVGHNGVGKSTLAQLAFRVLSPEGGTIRLLRRSIDKFTRAELCTFLCYLSQFPKHQILFGNIGQCREYLRRTSNTFSLALLEKYLALDSDYPMALLSPLQMKLLAIISSLSAETRLLILDEPTWGIDDEGTSLLLQLLQDLSSGLQELSLLIITHDLSLIKLFDPTVIWLHNGMITLFPSKHSFFSDEAAAESFDIPTD